MMTFVKSSSAGKTKRLFRNAYPGSATMKETQEVIVINPRQ